VGAEVHERLSNVSSRANAEIGFVSDIDNLGVEEDWDFPRDFRGNCETSFSENGRGLSILASLGRR
jgi:predicted transglutaminase-like cysteine proteinase